MGEETKPLTDKELTKLKAELKPASLATREHIDRLLATIKQRDIDAGNTTAIWNEAVKYKAERDAFKVGWDRMRAFVGAYSNAKCNRKPSGEECAPKHGWDSACDPCHAKQIIREINQAVLAGEGRKVDEKLLHKFVCAGTLNDLVKGMNVYSFDGWEQAGEVFIVDTLEQREDIPQNLRKSTKMFAVLFTMERKKSE